MSLPSDTLDRAMLLRAARAGIRGFGRVEPNPMVGCVIGRIDGTVLGVGHHRRFGGPHAEVEALNDCARRGVDPRGATAWVTLEPCSHLGKQPPCADALIKAGVACVVFARPDPNPVSAGGAEKLRAAGIDARLTDACSEAAALGEPFVRRITAGLPWVIAKWAQTIDGKVASRAGESKWISGEASRRRVHLLRGRVDAILTGIGTVLADDPMLTARGVPVRRIARRVVIDPDLRLPESCTLMKSIDKAPLTVVTGPLAQVQRAQADRLRSLGAEVVEADRAGENLTMQPVLRDLASRRGVSTVLVESGPGLLGRLFAEDMVDDALVFVGPMLLGDLGAPSPAQIGEHIALAEAMRMRLFRVARLGKDAVMWWRRRRD